MEKKDLALKNILCVPDMTKNLISVSKLTRDNHIYLKYHGYCCFIKDKAIRDILLKGTLKDGFYHLESVSRKKGVAPVYSNITNQQFMHKNKDISTFVLTRGTNPVKINVDVSKVVWHRRLEYPLSKILNSILKGCNLIVNDNNGKTKFCDYCQFGKSHNLPFPNS